MGNKLYISTGTGILQVDGTKHGKLRKLILPVWVVPEAPVTMISFSCLQDRGIEWDTGRNRLYWAETGKTVLETIQKHRLYFLEYNGPVLARPKPVIADQVQGTSQIPMAQETAFASANTHVIPKYTDALTWHRRFGPPGEERLQKMVEKYTGTRIIGIPTSQCEPYTLAKVKEIVSWKPVEERATQPFERM